MNAIERSVLDGSRYRTADGRMVNVEDLLNLGSTDQKTLLALDSIAMALDAQLTASSATKSFIGDGNIANTKIKNDLDTVVYVISIVKAREAERVEQKAAKTRRAYLLQLKAGKQIEADSKKSIADIDKELAKLG